MAKDNQLNNKKKAEIAYDLFVNTDKTQKEICEIVGWTQKTFTANKQKGMWEELKGAMTITPSEIILNLYKKMHDLSKADDIEADKLIKVASSIEKLKSNKATVSQTINVFKEFTNWLFSVDAELAKKTNIRQKEFIELMISNGH